MYYYDEDVKKLLTREKLCLYPWVIGISDQEYFVFYNIFDSRIKIFKKNEDSKHIASELHRVGFAFKSAECPLYFDAFIPDTPLNYTVNDLLVPEIYRIDFVIPSSDTEKNDIANLLFACESYVTFPGDEDNVKIAASNALLLHLVRSIKPKYATFSLGRLNSDKKIQKLFTYMSKLFDVLNSLNTVKILNIHFEDFTKMFNKLAYTFNVVNVNIRISDAIESELLDNALKYLHKTSNVLVTIFVDIFDTNILTSIINELEKKKITYILVPTNLNIIEKVVNSNEKIRYAILRSIVRHVSLENIGRVYYGFFTICKYGNIAIKLDEPIMLCSCKLDCFNKSAQLGNIKEYYELVRELRNVIAGWREREPCSSCAFRLFCSFCRHAFHSEERIPCILRRFYAKQ